jgi:hypothetical protein
VSALSIRKLPREIEEALLREARQKGKTKTEVVLEALEEKFHLGHAVKRREGLRAFFGKMSQGEYEEFLKATEDFSKVESDLWR